MLIKRDLESFGGQNAGMVLSGLPRLSSYGK